jgi:hypothetical protein
MKPDCWNPSRFPIQIRFQSLCCQSRPNPILTNQSHCFQSPFRSSPNRFRIRMIQSRCRPNRWRRIQNLQTYLIRWSLNHLGRCRSLVPPPDCCRHCWSSMKSFRRNRQAD